ncbi:hypothetical protein H0H93_003559 [Arthromyces matolae]|nr:hypothetical protein H0H93_003559 [Arthromyces matolae]
MNRCWESAEQRPDSAHVARQFIALIPEDTRAIPAADKLLPSVFRRRMSELSDMIDVHALDDMLSSPDRDTVPSIQITEELEGIKREKVLESPTSESSASAQEEIQITDEQEDIQRGKVLESPRFESPASEQEGHAESKLVWGWRLKSLKRIFRR